MEDLPIREAKAGCASRILPFAADVALVAGEFSDAAWAAGRNPATPTWRSPPSPDTPDCSR